MNAIRRLTHAFCLSTLLTALPLYANAADGVNSREFFGLLPIRDMTPFGFVRLDMRQSPAMFSASERPSVEFDFGYQNTWALSPDVKQYLKSRPRSPLTQSDIANLRAQPGEQFLLDSEVALLDVALNYPITNRLTIYGVLSAASYHGGFMDGVIENFHSTFGFEDFGRPGLTRNQVNIFFDLKGIQHTELDRPSDIGLLDPVVGLRYVLLPKRNTFNVVFDTAVKIPLSGDVFFSSGRTDVGAQVTAQWYKGHHALYASGSLVYYGGSQAPFTHSSELVPTGIVGYEFRLFENTNFIGQFYVSRSTVGREQTDLDELRGTKYQISLGLRQRFQRGYLSLAFTENLNHQNNTSDFGIQVSAGFDFGR